MLLPLRILLFSVAVLFLQSCSQNNNPSTHIAAPSAVQVKACNGMNFCYVKDDVEKSFNARWMKIPATFTTPERIRITYDENKGSFLLEIDVYGTSPGIFPITNMASFKSGDASFRYFDGALKLQGATGLVQIDDINNQDNTLSGSFYTSAEKNDTLHKFTDGIFADVSRK